VSVSHTTRKPRATEVEGRDYHFVTAAQFHQLIGQNAFLEHAQVFDNFYGTGAAQVRDKLAAGNDILLEIDWQGAPPGAPAPCPTAPASSSCRHHVPRLSSGCASARTDSAETIARRLADASTDMSHYDEFDYVVVNDQFERAAADLGAILDGGGWRVALQPTRTQASDRHAGAPRLAAVHSRATPGIFRKS